MEDGHQPQRVKSPPKVNLIREPSWASPGVRMMNKQATSPVTAYIERSRYMPPSSHQYNTLTQPKANLIIQKTNSRQHNIHLQTCNTVINPSTGLEMKYRNIIKNPTTKIVWTRNMANEFRRIAKVVRTRMKKGT